jgi:hypothetical protein
MKSDIKLFEKQQVRSIWDEENEKWWFSVLDVVAILTDQPDYTKTRNYWKWLKNKLVSEGSQLVSNTNQLKLTAPDGKKRLTDVMDTEQVFRLIQSIPSKKAEPFKLWLARVGRQRLDEVQDPELTINRAIYEYRTLGYDEDWINLRLQSIQIRKGLTDEWDKSGVEEGLEYAFLTDLMYKTWAGMNAKEYKKHKSLKKESLRDNMTNLELVVNMLAEASATELSSVSQPQGLNESAQVAQKGATVAKNARRDIERQGGKVISDKNARDLSAHKQLTDSKEVR